MKNYIYPAALALMLLSAASCNKIQVTEPQIPDELKDEISFSMQSDATAAPKTKAGFEATTRIVMRIQSDDRRTSPLATKYTRTVAEASAEVTKTGGFKCSDVTFSVENGLVRYWDDAYGRNSLLSVYAVAIPGKSGSASETLIPVSKLKEGTYTTGAPSTANVKEWGSCADNTIAWGVTTTTQTDALIANEDLSYSNNIQSTGSKGVYWYNFTNSKHIPDLSQAVTTGNDFESGRLLFRQNGVSATAQVTEAAGKFDKGHLNFTHALTRMTVQIIEGAGFTAGVGSDFKFNSGNVKVLQVPTSGTLNIQTGAWAASPTVTDINVLSPQGTYSDASGSYRAQFLPGYTFTDGDATNVLTFTIDNNTYYVTQNMLFDALVKDVNSNGQKDTGDGDLIGTTDPIEMQQGKNYVFKITVNKTEIKDITATLEPWANVTAANEDIYNSYINLSLSSPTGESCTDFDIYRLADGDDTIYTNLTSPTANDVSFKNWLGNYTDMATKTQVGTSNVWKTNWFFNDNKTFYHFRTVKSGTTINTTPDKDNFVITSGAKASTDPHWGAPMVNGATLKYDATEANASSKDKGNHDVTKEGFSTSIYKAIGSTTEQIKITEIHMMSNINIVLKTVTGDGAVKLFDDSKSEADKATKVTITRFANAGTVDMGTGFVRPTSPFTQEQLITSPGTTSAAYYKTAPAAETAAVSNPYTWAIVPQTLKRGTNDADYIGITIQTPDANQYYVIKRLSEITAESVKKGDTDYSDPNQNVNDHIEFWYPGHSYTYTFTISKKQIEDMTCTVAAWIDVKAADTPIDLED